MIKGVFINERLRMNEFSNKEILKRFDPATECWSSKDLKGYSYNMKEKEYEDEVFFYTTYTFSQESSCDTLYNVYKIIMEAENRLLKVFRYSPNTLLVVCQNMDDPDLDSYMDTINELVRIVTFATKYLSSSDDIKNYLSEYIDSFINWKEK